jgi:hypothetical protein
MELKESRSKKYSQKRKEGVLHMLNNGTKRNMQKKIFKEKGKKEFYLKTKRDESMKKINDRRARRMMSPLNHY